MLQEIPERPGERANDAMIRFSPETFVRHAGRESMLWNRRSAACVVLEEAEPFLKHIDWMARPETRILARIAEGAGVAPDVLADDFRGFIDSLATDGLVEKEEGVVAPDGRPAVRSGHGNFDRTGTEREGSWTPLGDFFRVHGIPAELHVDLTAACTERCVHCYLPDYPVKHLPFASVEKALREFRALEGLTVHLTGGECMLHPDFERICVLCKDLRLNFIVLSNLTACDAGRTAFLAEIRPQYVNVSLYSMDPEEHDAITRLPGSWRRTMDAIRRCAEAGVHIRLATPLLKENKGAFGALAQFAQRHRMHLVPNIDIVPRSDHDCSNLDHACTAEELRRVLEANKALFDWGWEAAAVPDGDAKVCEMGLVRLYLGSSGNYYPCDGMHGYVLGNVSRDALESIWHGEKLTFLKDLRNRDFPVCQACADRAFCKVCPAFNFNATGNLFKPIPGKCAIAATVHGVYGGRKPC